MTSRDLVLECRSFQEVLDTCASRLSAEGLYVETATVVEVGSEVAFEVRIPGSFSVLRGDGEVVGIEPGGVYLRFVYLDQPSLKLLPKLLDHYRRAGISPLELPAAATVERSEDELEAADQVQTGERGAATEIADELSPEVEPEGLGIDAPPPEAAAIGLTLDDLEAEFAGATPTVGETEAESEGAGEAATGDGSLEDEARLIDPVDLIADDPAASGFRTSDDIHLSSLISAEEAAGRVSEAPSLPGEAADAEISIDSPEPDEILQIPELDGAPPLDEQPAEDAALVVDPGLPWLPDEQPATRGRKDLWIILILVIVGALLGVAFYYFFVYPRQSDSRRTPSPEEVEARLVSPALAIEPIADAATSNQPEVADPGAEEGTPPAPAITEAPQTPASLPDSTTPVDRPMTGVDRVTWTHESGETVVTFWADGRFAPEQIDDFRVVDGSPREVVRIRGVRRPFDQSLIELDSELIHRIRVGYHQESGGGALHFVADLVDSDVELLRTEAAGEQLHAYFAKTG